MEGMSESRINDVISYFNSVTGQRLRFCDSNAAIVKKALAVFSFDELKAGIKTAVAESDENKDIYLCITSVMAKRATEKTEEKAEAVKGLSLLEKAVVEMIAKTQTDTLREEMMKDLRHTCDTFLMENYGAVTRKVNYEFNGAKVDFGSEVVHKSFETVLKFVAADEPVFLTGAAGCGKNVICKQVAKALGLPFYFSNAVTQEYKITGFTDAMGTFHETQFYKAFKNGGVFMLDEIDASIPEVLVILNAAIANRYFDFPAPIGYVEAHKDFRVIAAGNTFGLGADMEYVGRNQLDMASLDRFALVEIDYDIEIEKRVANNDLALVAFAEDFRNACAKAGVRMVVSYRAIGRIAKMKEAIGVENALKTCLLKNLQKDDVQMIAKEMTVKSGEWFEVLNKFTK